VEFSAFTSFALVSPLMVVLGIAWVGNMSCFFESSGWLPALFGTRFASAWKAFRLASGALWLSAISALLF